MICGKAIFSESFIFKLVTSQGWRTIVQYIVRSEEKISMDSASSDVIESKVNSEAEIPTSETTMNEPEKIKEINELEWFRKNRYHKEWWDKMRSKQSTYELQKELCYKGDGQEIKIFQKVLRLNKP